MMPIIDHEKRNKRAKAVRNAVVVSRQKITKKQRAAARAHDQKLKVVLAKLMKPGLLLVEAQSFEPKPDELIKGSR